MNLYHQYCTLCGAQALKDLPAFKRHYLCKCSNCGHVFARKIPDQATLISHYDGYGRDDYLSPLTVQSYHRLLDTFEPFRNTGKLLDMGCGIGYFLEEAKKRGWEVYGTEYSTQAVNICASKGIHMKSGAVSKDMFAPGMFDVVTSFEVIEHLHNVHDFVSAASLFLRSKGLLYITTPNFNSLLRYALGEKYNVLGYPEHLSYFTRSTLIRLAESEGFTTTKVLTTGLSVSRCRTSMQNDTNANAVSPVSTDEKIRKAFGGSLVMGNLKNAINGLLNGLGLGDSLKGYFVRR
ncbi:MAG: class I SAM-dependent methyltransferase [Flavobacteriales bacterium]|nr:class I SAM-dependent methyltransferase [Flavobacteriales bacterium]